VPRTEIPTIRRAEQTAAAKAVGVNDLAFLGYPDGRVEVSIALRRDIAREIRRVRPDRVLCPSPERIFTRIFASHPDHLAVGEAALCAVYPDARNPFAHPELLDEGYEAHTVAEVWLMATPRPDHFVDVTANFSRKIAALRAHESQHPDPDGLEARIRQMSGTIAAAGGLGDTRMAEAFQVVATR
jgi:LmbE family N-acetylglucosaminyl deacetylase